MKNQTLPTSFESCSPKLADFILSVISAADIDEVTAKFIIWARICKVRIIGHAPSPGIYLAEIKGKAQLISAEDVALELRNLNWIFQPLPRPWRPKRIAGRRPLHADLREIHFGQFLAIQNLFSGYIITKRRDILAQLINEISSEWRTCRSVSDRDELAVLMWLAAVNNKNAADYPFLFSSSSEDNSLADDSAPSPDKIRDSMNAQIRALTKGDVTKERRILEISVDRALTELNAIAREAAELKAKSSS
ncbi:MAG: hypothetical protein K2M45_08240 [Muribaculaceae bacterium]|nr:hypothetical protein [Muribaculaceae bacterium]